MTIKHSTTHGSTRKNKRIMSGGKGKISNYTQRFKNIITDLLRLMIPVIIVS